MDLISDLNEGQLFCLGKPHHNWHLNLAYNACYWIFFKCSLTTYFHLKQWYWRKLTMGWLSAHNFCKAGAQLFAGPELLLLLVVLAHRLWVFFFIFFLFFFCNTLPFPGEQGILLWRKQNEKNFSRSESEISLSEGKSEVAQEMLGMRATEILFLIE